MKLSNEESRALAFIAFMLIVSAGARFVNRPGPTIIEGEQVSIDSLEAASLALVGGGARTAAPDDEQTPRTLNANTITEADLARIPRLKPEVARAIVARRSAMGGRLRSLEDLKGVRGVTPAVLKALEPRLNFGTWDNPYAVAVPAAAPGQFTRRGPSSRPVPPTPAAPTGKLNLNAATAAELETLPGVGPKLAETLLEHRARRGRFASWAQVDSVPGVGPALLARLKEGAVL